MMGKKKMPKSIRQHIRQEKARIRREVLSPEKQKELIDKLYQEFFKKDENPRNIQPSIK
jgi:hypothetical protein